MNEFADKVFEYLTSPGGSADRKLALKDLVTRTAFSSHWTNKGTIEVVEKYLNENPRNFCQDGINRFRKALDLNPTTRKAKIEIEIEVGDEWSAVYNGTPFTDDSMVATEITRLLTAGSLAPKSGIAGDRFRLKSAKITQIGKLQEDK